MKYLENKSNRNVTIVCLVIAIACIYFMNDDSLFRISQHGASSAIGSFEDLQKDVRRKNIANYFWDDIKAKDQLSEGDSIFTGAGSSVNVKLSNGQLITIAPNSLIKFSMKNKKLQLDIPYGSVQLANVVDDVTVLDCGQNFSLTKNNEAVSLKKSERCGTISAKSKSNKIAKVFNEKVKQDVQDLFVAAFELDKDRNIAAVPLLVQSPKFESLNLKYTANESKPLFLKWTSVDNAASYEVELSDTAQFDQVQKISTLKPEVQLTKLSSKMFFRAKSISVLAATSEYSETGSLDVSFPVIKLTNPKIEKNFKAKNSSDNGGQSTFKVAWSKVPYAASYKIELNNANLNKKANEFSSRKPASELNIASAGKYTYRVLALDSRGRQISSSGVGEILYNKVFSLLAPIIKQGANDKFFFFQKNAAKYVWLNWVPQGSENKFKVEISTDKAFSSVLKSAYTAKQKFLVTEEVASGEYFWRVRSETADQQSDWSATEMFKVQVGKKQY